ncbi:MAG: hypothetical protein ACLU9S_15560 [Oscillospiraceae bacterium]
MDKKQMPISELPFNFDGLEPQYGQIKHAELICPGVYFIMTKFNTDRPRFAGEYLVVTEDSPAISPKHGTSPPRFRPFQGCSYASMIMTAKADMSWSMRPIKYLVEHGLPLPEGESLEEARAFGREVCPEYFGEFPIPEKTPWGTGHPSRPPVERALLAGDGAGGLGAGHRFIRFTPSCLRILWHLRPKSKMAKKRKPAATVFIPIGRAAVRSLKCFRMTRMAGDKIDGAALQKRALRKFPDYGLEDERNSPDLPAEQRILPIRALERTFIASHHKRAIFRRPYVLENQKTIQAVQLFFLMRKFKGMVMCSDKYIQELADKIGYGAQLALI